MIRLQSFADSIVRLRRRNGRAYTIDIEIDSENSGEAENSLISFPIWFARGILGGNSFNRASLIWRVKIITRRIPHRPKWILAATNYGAQKLEISDE